MSNHKLLVDAVNNNNPSKVREFLNLPNIFPSFDNNLLLRTSILKGFNEVADILLFNPTIMSSINLNEIFCMVAECGNLYLTNKLIKLPLYLANKLIKLPNINPAVFNNYALRYASGNNHIKIVKFLLADERIDPSFPLNEPINQAAFSNLDDIVQLLWQHKEVRNTLKSDNFALYDKLKTKDLILKINSF